MKLKQTGALLLASVMMVGTIGIMNPTQVQAADPAPTNQYTLTVPAETTLAYDGSAEKLTNGLKVSGGDLEDGKKVTVTASSANEWVLKGSKTETTTTIAYGLYAASDVTETTTSWDFDKTAAAGDGTTVDIYSKIIASDYQSATTDDYSDTITFTADVVDAIVAEPVKYTKTDSSGTLSTDNLGTATQWVHNSTTYEIYNDFIPYTLGTSWNDAMGFVAALNEAQFDGHNNWTLLSSKEMAQAYYEEVIEANKTTGSGSSEGEDGEGEHEGPEQPKLWSTVVSGSNDYYRYYLKCEDGGWFTEMKNYTGSNYGFVVLHPAN